jgi:hypothetical protein
MPFLPTSLMGRPRTIVTSSLNAHDRLDGIVIAAGVRGLRPGGEGER